MKKQKKSLYEAKKEAINDFMRVYDKGSRDDVMMYYHDVCDVTADSARKYGREVGLWKGRFYGLLIGTSIAAGVKLRDAIKKAKAEKEKTNRMNEFIARHEEEEST